MKRCTVANGRLLLFGSAQRDCAVRVFALDSVWQPQFPRDERAIEGAAWVSDARRVDHDWVQVTINQCND